MVDLLLGGVLAGGVSILRIVVKDGAGLDVVDEAQG